MRTRTLLILVSLGPLLIGATGCSLRLQSTGGDGGVWFSSDRGQSWEQRVFVGQEKRRKKTIGQVDVSAIAVHPRASERVWIGSVQGGIYRSTNRGERWQQMATGGPVRSLAPDSVNPNVLFAIVGNRLLKTVDDGQNWQALYVESNPGVIPTVVVTHPILSSRIYLGTSDGRVLVSDTYGSQWDLLTSLERRITSILIQAALPNEIYITSSESGLSRSLDRGQTFEKLDLALRTFPQSRMISFASLHVVRSDVILTLVTRGGILRSRDRGATFLALPQLTTGSRQPEIRAYAAAPGNPERLIYATATTIFRTLDSGEHWITVRSPSRRSPNVLAYDSKNLDWIYLGAAQIKEKKSLF